MLFAARSRNIGQVCGFDDWHFDYCRLVSMVLPEEKYGRHRVHSSSISTAPLYFQTDEYLQDRDEP